VNCNEVQALLQAYVTRELEPDRREFVDEHLVECGACQRELALVSAVISSLDHQPVLEPPHDFAAHVMRRLPDQRRFVPGPAWALLILPALGGVVWLLRSRLVELLLAGARTIGIDSARLPAPGPAQMTVFGIAVVALGAISVAGFVVIGWRLVRD
jgi:anti-sigma factor RsiW